jgi:uroporphyrin-III C-methyltransferase
MSGVGTVWLVGAGPGAADLITRRGLRVLRTADVVLYDALISPDLLTECRPECERIYVGKRGYCIGSTVQGDINELMVNLARQGKTVCRLKGGDPCVFGRGGEEAQYLTAHGIPCAVVPGVTAATALATAGFALTHRAAGATVTLVTGHFDPDTPDGRLPWSALAQLGNLVFYMGVRHFAKITAHLSAAGADGATPAAVVAAITRPEQTCVLGTLADIAEQSAGVPAPALLVVGPIVAQGWHPLSDCVRAIVRESSCASVD